MGPQPRWSLKRLPQCEEPTSGAEVSEDQNHSRPNEFPPANKQFRKILEKKKRKETYQRKGATSRRTTNPSRPFSLLVKIWKLGPGIDERFVNADIAFTHEVATAKRTTISILETINEESVKERGLIKIIKDSPYEGGLCEVPS